MEAVIAISILSAIALFANWAEDNLAVHTRENIKFILTVAFVIFLVLGWLVDCGKPRTGYHADPWDDEEYRWR